MQLDWLIEVIGNDAALRRRQLLQPVGGKGDKIFPPTYPGEGDKAPPRHVFERRRIVFPGETESREVWCVLVDSVQSQANRLEESLGDAIQEGMVIPHVVVDFSDSNLVGISRITSLDAPHRIYDAILRDSQTMDGATFMNSAIGQALARASTKDATAVLEVSPNALLFGSWHSTGQGGGLGAKFARCLTSEIFAVDVPVDVLNSKSGEVSTSGRRTGSRLDPLGVLRKVEVFKGPNGWDTKAELAGAGAKQVRPSAINHGNIPPSIQALGITCDYLEHSFVLSFAALRRLRFGGPPDKDAAGRALLAALGLLALVEQDARGYSLRSRCELVCDGKAPLELIHADGSTETIDLKRDQVRELYVKAFERAESKGFKLRPKTELKPQEKLVEIVRRSQELALSGSGGEEEGNDTTS